jgi:hypothetical protein
MTEKVMAKSDGNRHNILGSILPCIAGLQHL